MTYTVRKFGKPPLTLMPPRPFDYAVDSTIDTAEALDNSETVIDTSADATSALPAGTRILINSEYMTVTAVSATDITVVRENPVTHDTGQNIFKMVAGNCTMWLPGTGDAYSGTIRDRSGYGNNGTITGATWLKTNRGVPYLSFDGDDLVNLGTAASLFSGAGTILLWFNCTDGTGNKPLIANDPVGATVGDFYILRNNTAASGKLRVIWDSPAVDIQGDALLALSTWHCIAVRWGDPGVSMFVAGVKQAATSAEVVTTVRGTQTAMAMGVDRVASPSAYFIGGIALARVFNAAVPDTIIAGYFTRERGLFGV